MNPPRSRPVLRLLILAVAVLLPAALPAIAADDAAPRPFVSPIFGDNMVLQRGKPNTLWGWTQPGQEVRVTIEGRTAKTQAADDGRWSVAVEPPAPGGPYVVAIDGAQHVELHDVLVGDVWLCSGQSNMEFALARAKGGAEEVKAADHPEIRFFIVGSRVAYQPVDVPQGSWKICSPATVAPEHGPGGLSAVAYYFARRVQAEVHVPIGLVQAAVGGTPAESWTSPAGLRPLGDFDAQLDQLKKLRDAGAPEYGNYVAHWYDEFDPGQKNRAWFAPDLDTSDWKTVTLTDGFRQLGVPETPAVCYFRRTITLPDPLPAGMAKVELGVIEHMDTVAINGQEVGASAWVENPRVYPLWRPGVLKPGKNVIVIRVLKTKPDGGFMTPPEKLRLVLGDGTAIPLAGEWQGKLAVDARPPHPLPLSYDNWPVMPAVLSNGMIAPITPLALTGALWYQGEQNSPRAAQYRRLLPAMIADWRQRFQQGDFPFYIVSLPAFEKHHDTPEGDDDWAEMRGAQAFAARTVKNAGLAVAIDVGDADNIHPTNKQPVGERLAALALAKHYGRDIPYAGPEFKSLERLPAALRIHFSHTDGGLVAKGGKAAEFAIAGADGKWHWADAKIDGDTIIVSSSDVTEPVNVRYAWQSNPTATLFNGAGFPAVPFRTDR